MIVSSIGFSLGMILFVVVGASGAPADSQQGWALLGSGPAGKPIELIDVKKEAAVHRSGAPHGTTYVKQTITAPEKQGAIGVVLKRQMESWPVTAKWSVHFWLKLSENPKPKAWSVVLFDQEGRRAVMPLGNRAADNEWHEFSLPLRVLEVESGFNFGKLATWQLETPLPKGTTVSIDHLYFYHPVTQEAVVVLD